MNVYEQLRHPLALLVFLLTLFFPVIVGFLVMRRNRSQDDFFVGGRAMNKIAVALSAVSSGRSSWLVLGVSGMAYTLGIDAVWAVAGYTLVEFFQCLWIGPRLRRETETSNDITLLDYFESHYQDAGHWIRITGAVIIGIFITAYVAAQLNAGAKSLSIAMGIPVEIALIAAAAMILVYMVLGGFIAVMYNDVIRAVLMLFGLLILPAVGLMSLGGWSVVKQLLNTSTPAHLNWFSIGAGSIIGFLGIGLGSPGQPHIVVRYMSINDADKLKQSAWIGLFWNVLMGIGAVMIGLLGRAVIPDVKSLPGLDAETIYLVLSSKYFSSVFYGLLIGGIFAAILSTADSQLLVVASTFVRDIYEKILHADENIAEARKMRLSRMVLVFSGILALILAWLAKDVIFWLVLFAWGGLGASFGPALILSLYWKRTTISGVMAGMITGTVITIIWRIWLKPVTGIYELIPAFFGALLMIVMVSILQKRT